MKSTLWILILGFGIIKLTAQTYLDLDFAEANGMELETIEVTNLTKGWTISLQGADTLRLNPLISGIPLIGADISGISVFPNPMQQNGHFSIVTAQPGSVVIQLHRLNGSLLHQSSYDLQQGTHQFEVSGLSSGVFLLSAISLSGTVTARIVSAGNSYAQVEAQPSVNKAEHNQDFSQPAVSRINVQTSNRVEVSFNEGDQLKFFVSAEGHVNQTLISSPTVSQTIHFLLTQVVDVYNPTTGKIWMDRNLGASRVATAIDDAASFGDLYQWGRGTDGHEKRNSLVMNARSASDSPSHGKFITANSGDFDWRSPQNDNLWQGENGTNNPCPEGYRLPTEAEWQAERLSWTNQSSTGAFQSALKLPMGGTRLKEQGKLVSVGSYSSYWSSTAPSVIAAYLGFSPTGCSINYYYRSQGLAVRCIKD